MAKPTADGEEFVRPWPRASSLSQRSDRKEFRQRAQRACRVRAAIPRDGETIVEKLLPNSFANTSLDATLPDGSGGVIPAAEIHRVELAALRDRFTAVVNAVAEIHD